MTQKRIFILLVLLCVCCVCRAQMWSVSTNAASWAYLGTINGEVSVAAHRNISINASAMYNPWTFSSEKGPFQDRQRSVALGIRYWPWHVYSGWWIAAKAQYQEYNRGGMYGEVTSEEGDALGGSLSFGYTLMLNKWLNLEFGAGVWGGSTQYKVYACPRCGKVLDSGNKWFVRPNELIISLVFVL